MPGRVLTAACLATALLCASGLATAQEPSLEEAIRSAAARYASATAVVQEAPPAPVRALTLDQATELALAHNLDIVVQRANPETYDLQLAGLRAGYLPTVSSLLGGQRQADPPTTSLVGGQRVTATTSTFNGALSENLPWGGGTVGVSWNNDRVSTNSFLYNFNPTFNTTVTAQLSQPLLRGLRTDALRQQIVVAKANRAISDLQLRQTTVNTIAAVRNAYWDLVFAIDSVAVATKSVDLAHQLVVEDQKRVQFGTMTRLDLITAESQEAASRHALVAAAGDRRTAELALKRLLVSGRDDPFWQASLEPTDRPAASPPPIDLEASIRRALAERTDLAEARRQEAANQAAFEYLRDRTRPQADLVGTYALAGVGGTALVRPGNDLASFLTGPVVARIPGGYGDALHGLSSARYPTWGLSLNVSYPIGFSAARADAARARVQLKQVEAEIRQVELQVVSDVTNAAIQVRNNADGIESARTARDLARQRLDAEQRKFASGVSTNYLVVQAQRDLADAENAELKAEVAYRKALVEFDRVQQTTLQASGVTIVAPGTGALPVGSGSPAVQAPSGSIFR